MSDRNRDELTPEGASLELEASGAPAGTPIPMLRAALEDGRKPARMTMFRAVTEDARPPLMARSPRT